MENNTQFPNPTPSRVPLNGIASLQGFLRFVGFMFVLLLGIGIGLFMAGNPGSKVSKDDVLTNPVFANANFVGKLKSTGGDLLVMEKDGRELTVYTNNETSVLKFNPAGGVEGQSSSMNSNAKVSDLSVGENLTVQVKFKTEGKKSELKAFAITILVNTPTQ